MTKRRKILVVVALAALIAGATVAIVVPVAIFIVSARPPKNYLVSPYFSHERFKQVTQGMTPEEVRDLIGPPLLRRKYETGNCDWVYTTQDRPDKAYRSLCVVFDKDGRVLGTRGATGMPFQDPDTGEWTRIGRGRTASPWTVTAFDLPMIQGDAPAVSGDSSTVYVIEVMASWCGPCHTSRLKLEQFVKEASASSPTPIQLMLISVDEDEQAIRDHLKKHALALPVARDPKRTFAEPMGREVIPQFLILRGNTVYPFDFAHYAGQSEGFYEDLAWFVSHFEPRR